MLEAYIDEMLSLGDTSEATATLQNLFEFLRSDIVARACPRLPMRDPAELIGTFIKEYRRRAPEILHAIRNGYIEAWDYGSKMELFEV